MQDEYTVSLATFSVSLLLLLFSSRHADAMPPPWTVIYPPFEDRGRAEACVLERANSSSRLRLTVSRSSSRGSLMLGASNGGLSLAGLPTSLEPNHYYRQRATSSHAKFRALAAQPRPRVLGQSRGASAGADGFGAAEPEPEPEPEPSEPRFARHVGHRNDGAADKWEHQLSKKYASLDQGVNTSKAFQMIDKNRDSVMDRDEVLHAMVSGGVKVSAADLDDIMAQADANHDGHVSPTTCMSRCTLSARCCRCMVDDPLLW